MKKMISVLLASLVFAATAHAAGSATGTVTYIYSMPNGTMLVGVSGAISGSPSCHTGGQRFSVDATSTAGKVTASNLQMAFALGKTVNFNGTAACTAWADTETISFIAVNQ